MTRCGRRNGPTERPARQQHRCGTALALALVAVAVLLPGSATAQHFVKVRVTPRAGLLTPADWFYEEFPHFGTDPMEWTEAAVLQAPLVGVTAEVEPTGSRLWLRGEFLTTLGDETAVTYAVLIPASTAGPARVERTPFRVATSITTGSFDIGLPTAFRLPLGIQPYVTAGIGGKRYAFDNSEIDRYEGEMVLPQSGTVLTGNVGAGLTFHLSGIGVDLLVRDAISNYWGKQQHDVMLLAGLTWTVY